MSLNVQEILDSDFELDLNSKLRQISEERKLDEKESLDLWNNLLKEGEYWDGLVFREL